MDLVSAAAAFLTSFVLVVPFVAFLRPRWLGFAAGATFVALAALLVEVLVQNALQPLYAAAVVLVFVAPLTEELLKFLDSGLTGANYASAAGAGIGFAATENALYFLAAWGEPLTYLVALIAVRAATDPLLHVTTTTLTTLSWHGRPWGLPAGIALHALWNTVALVEVVINPTVGLFLLGAAGFTVLGILLLLRRSPDVRDTLDDQWRMNPWSGALRAAGAV
jgi:RsiW-degrading membrane proteinase PrsW (M82 family)